MYSQLESPLVMTPQTPAHKDLQIYLLKPTPFVSSSILWRRILLDSPPSRRPPALTNKHADHVDNPHEACAHGVDDGLPARGLTGEHEAEATVDDTKGDSETAKEKMAVRPEGAATIALVEDVVEVAQGCLEEEESE